MHSGEAEIRQEQKGADAVVRVRGTVHMENSPRLRSVLLRLVKGRTPAVIVCFEGASSVDTSGLATLVECSQNMQAYGGRLLVVGLNSRVADSYSLAGVEGTFPMFDSEAAAVEALRGWGSSQAESPEEKDTTS